MTLLHPLWRQCCSEGPGPLSPGCSPLCLVPENSAHVPFSPSGLSGLLCKMGIIPMPVYRGRSEFLCNRQRGEALSSAGPGQMLGCVGYVTLASRAPSQGL